MKAIRKAVMAITGVAAAVAVAELTVRGFCLLFLAMYSPGSLAGL